MVNRHNVLTDIFVQTTIRDIGVSESRLGLLIKEFGANMGLSEEAVAVKSGIWEVNYVRLQGHIFGQSCF